MKRSVRNTILGSRSFLPFLAIALCSFGPAIEPAGLHAGNGMAQLPGDPTRDPIILPGDSIILPGDPIILPGDSIIIFKNNLSRGHKIALYTDASQTAVFFNVKGHQGNVYHLYVFDMDGRLIKHTEARSEQTTYIKKMEKGIYLFEVFNNDDKIGNGQIAVM